MSRKNKAYARFIFGFSRKHLLLFDNNWTFFGKTMDFNGAALVLSGPLVLEWR